MPEPTHFPNLHQLIRHFEQLSAASGAPPAAVTLTDYGTSEAMALPGEPPDSARFTAACAVQRAFIDWLRARGVAVRVRAFRAADYTAWLDGRTDSRSLRATYAATLTDAENIREGNTEKPRINPGRAMSRDFPRHHGPVPACRQAVHFSPESSTPSPSCPD